MNIKSKRFVIVLLTLVFTVSVFAVTAFAEGDVTPVSEDPVPASSAVTETSSTTVGENSTAAETSSTTMEESSASSPKEEVSSEPSSHTPASSRGGAASSKAPAPTRTVDTNAKQVEAMASQAAQAVSDPDVLSSENWSELLSSGDSTQSQNAAAGALAVSSTASTAEVGGVSWILILGVVLIVLALCGFGLFIYLQFFSNSVDGPNKYGGPGVRKNNSGNAPAEKSSEAPQTFTDISSASDGKQHRDDYVPGDTQGFVDIRSSSSAAPVKPAAKPRTVKKAPVNDVEITRPIPQAPLPDRKPAVTEQSSEPRPKSQATPVSNNSDFDWEKFFNEQK